MEHKQINEVLRTLRSVRRSAPDFRNAVWREICHRKALGEEAEFSDNFRLKKLLSMFAPTAVAGLVAAALVAWVVGYSWDTPADYRTRATALVLDFGVFGPNADGLAHDRLVVNR